MPTASSGCLTCKERRIKCDETRPVCQRCVKSRRICRGATIGSLHDPIFHTENAYASRLVKRPRGPRPTPAAQVMGDIETIVEDIPQRLFLDLRTVATTYYLHCHMQRLDDFPVMVKSVADDVLVRVSGMAPTGAIELGLSSLALAIFHRTQRYQPAAVEASKLYSDLLRNTQAALVTIDAHSIDTCLLAIFLMARYEDSVYRPQAIPATPKSFSHHDGATAVLKIWKDHLSETYAATDVMRHSRRGILRSALLQHRAPPQWLMDGVAFGEEDLSLEYDLIMVRATIIRSRVRELLHDDSEESVMSPWFAATIEELNKECRDLDNALQDYVANFPLAWAHEEHDLSTIQSWPLEGFFSPLVYSFRSASYAVPWNQYFTLRMLVNSTRLRVLDLSPLKSLTFIQAQRTECQANLDAMVDCLLATIPFCLERFRVRENASLTPESSTTILLNKNEDPQPYIASLLAWPMGIASSLRDVRPDQRKWIKAEIAKIGRMIGMGVIESAGEERWLEF